MLTEIGYAEPIFVLILQLLLNGAAHFVVLLLKAAQGLLTGGGSIAVAIIQQ